MVELRDNNPFRDAAFRSSTPVQDNPPARLNTNPFLDTPAISTSPPAAAASTLSSSPAKMPSGMRDGRRPMQLGSGSGSGTSLRQDASASRRLETGASRTTATAASTHLTVPSSHSTRPATASKHDRPSGSHNTSGPSGSGGGGGRSSGHTRRPRSVSEASGVEGRLERNEKERERDKERDRERRRARAAAASGGSGTTSARHGLGETKDGAPDKEAAKEKEKARRRKHLDKIDLLDVTGLSIAGGFHHDGPFDACNPSRNKNAKKAPVLAFAKDSTAMSMAAGPPVQPVYFGDHVSDPSSFDDYNRVGSSGGTGLPGGSTVGKVRPGPALRSASFDPTIGIEPVHGYETTGLGTSTFLEGAPASRAAMMARTYSETSVSGTDGMTGAAGFGDAAGRPRATSDHASGLGRKKSVIQRLRGAYKDRNRAEPGVASTSTGHSNLIPGSVTYAPGLPSPGEGSGGGAMASPPAYASLPGATGEYFDDRKEATLPGSAGSSSTAGGGPLHKTRSAQSAAPGYASHDMGYAVSGDGAGTIGEADGLSPLYRPASRGATPGPSAGGASGGGGGAPGLMKRVKSLRVGGAGGKRKE